MALRLRENKNINGIKVKIDDKAHIIKISQLADDTTLFVSSKTDIALHDASFASKSPFKFLEFKFFDRVYTRNLNQKTWTDLDGIEMHPIFFQLGWNLDGDWPIRRQNPYQHQFVNVNNNNYTCCAKMAGKEETPTCRKKTVTWTNEMIEDLIDFIEIHPIVAFEAIYEPILISFWSLISFAVQLYIIMQYKGQHPPLLPEMPFCLLYLPPKLVCIHQNFLHRVYTNLNMVDINSYLKSLKVSWVKRLLSSKTSNWKVIPRKYLDKFGKNWLIFKMNMDNGKSIENFKDIPEFYKEIINCWVEFGGGQTKTPTNFREIRNQNIWGNKYIKFNNKSLIYKNWIDSNLLYVNDITDENGRVSQDYLIETLKN